MDPSAYILETFPFYLSLSLSAILYRLVPGRAVKREFECFFFLFLFSSFLYMWPFKPWREREREKKKLRGRQQSPSENCCKYVYSRCIKRQTV